jgi:hypothetical protein
MDSNSYQMNAMSSHQLPNAHLGGVQQRMSGPGDNHTNLPSLNEGLPPFPSSYMSPHPLTSTASYPSVSQPSQAANLPQLQPQRQPSHLSPYSQAGSYSMSQSMMPPSSAMMAPSLSTSAGPRALPDLHPRPTDGGFMSQLQSASMLTPAQNPANEPEPTHVVGQQGRRGILPSAPGRAPGNVKSAIPQKDANGKYPCPHCSKTYQHAKHLKRHLLRRMSCSRLLVLVQLY